MQLSEQTTNIEPQLERITIVLRPQEISTLSQIRQFIQLGAPVAIGRGIAVIASCSDRDSIEELERAESQLVLAEAALKRATPVTVGADHLPALRRVIDHIMTVALPVADRIKYSAVENGDDHETAEEAAGQAIRVAVMIRQALEKLLEPDLFNAPNLVDASGKPTLVAETPYAQVRVTNIDEWIKTVKNAQRYEWLRDKDRVEDMDTSICAARDDQCYFETELDTEIDNGMRLARLLEKHGELV
ncbi:hypothetical protein [Pseudomonas sp.]